MANRKDETGQPYTEWVKGYLTVGFYEDGTVGEIFVKMDRMGSEVSGMLDSWAIAFSMLLQRGADLCELIKKYKGAQFEPSGMTGDQRIPFARSPVDYICRILEYHYVPRSAAAEN